MRLYWYFMRKFIVAFVMIAGGLGLFAFLIDTIEVSGRFADADVSFWKVIGLTALRMPELFNQMMPLFMILASIAMFLSVARTSELVVTRAAGRSAMRALLAPVGAALAIGILAFLIGNPIVAATKNKYKAEEAKHLHGGGSVLSVAPSGLWLRQGGPDGQVVIRARRANENGTNLHDVTFLGFDSEAQPSYRIHANRAQLAEGRWELTDAKHWTLSAEPGAANDTFETGAMNLASTLTAEQIVEGFSAPERIAWWNLRSYIQGLEEAGFSARVHRLWMQSELARPLLLVGMVMIGASLTMRHTRAGSTGPLVIAAIALGFLAYFINNFARILGENGQIPLTMAAWAPPVATILLAMGIILHLEDG